MTPPQAGSAAAALPHDGRAPDPEPPAAKPPAPQRRVPAPWRRAFATLTLLGGATAFGAVLVFLTQTLLARVLGPADYGLFASSLATVTMIAPLAGFGLTQFRLKAYGAEGWGAHRWMRSSLRFTTLTTGIALAVLLGWASLGAPADGTRFALWVLSPVVLSILAVDLASNKMRLEDRFRAMALWQLAIPASRFAVAAALLALPQLDGRFVAVSYGAIAIVVAVLAIPQLRALAAGRIDLHGHGPRERAVPIEGPPPGIAALWSQAWAFGVYAALYPVFYQIATVLLKYLAGDAPAGRWSIALAVMTAIYLIPATIYQKYLLSKLHRWAVHDRPKFWRVYRQGNVGMLLLGIAVGAGLAIAAPFAVPLVFGPQYVAVVPILTVLALCPPIRFLSTAIGAALLTENHMRLRVYAIAFATVAAIALNVALIPRLGEFGAAWGTVGAELLLLAGTWLGVRRFHRIERERDRAR
ncbi:oligosaccharide flippase family protein [Tolypothrix campylonemoides VB511288]|nr:oligosaccharide flippase family protein [Tolypothrix campylonemoides VB511288]